MSSLGLRLPKEVVTKTTTSPMPGSRTCVQPEHPMANRDGVEATASNSIKDASGLQSLNSFDGKTNSSRAENALTIPFFA